MTYAPATIQATRRLKLQHLDLHPTSHNYPDDLDPGEVGIVGDTAHAVKGTSYHLGADQLTSTAYSRRTARDRAGLSNAASAEDVGFFRITTPLGTFDLRHYTAWIFRQCRASAPDTLDLREVIGTVDGKTVLRWDAERGRSSAPRSGEADSSHLFHTHKAWYRDSEGRDDSKSKLDERYLREIGVIEGGDDMNEAQDLVQHFINYRTEAIRANKTTIVIPPRGTFKGLTETNELAVALARLERKVDDLTARPAADVDEAALAELLRPHLPGGVDLAAVAAAVRPVIRAELDGTRLARG